MTKRNLIIAFAGGLPDKKAILFLILSFFLDKCGERFPSVFGLLRDGLDYVSASCNRRANIIDIFSPRRDLLPNVLTRVLTRQQVDSGHADLIHIVELDKQLSESQGF